MSASRFTHPPGAVLGAAALGYGALAALVVGSSSTPAFAVAVIGVLGVAAGVLRSDRRLAALGALTLLAGVAIAGIAAAPPGVLLPAAAGALLAWDLGAGSFAARSELAGGAVERTEVVQVVAATGVAAVTTGAAYGLYQTLSVGVSPTGVLLLVVAAAALGLALKG